MMKQDTDNGISKENKKAASNTKGKPPKTAL